MRAVWYDRQGAADEVLEVGELPDPAPGPGRGAAGPPGRRDRHRYRPPPGGHARVDPAVAHAVGLDEPDPAAAVRAHAPEGVDRIVEVAFSDNVDLDAAVCRVGTVIAAYATRQDRPSLPFWPMLFDNLTIRLLGSDDFPAEAKQQAADDLTAAAREGALTVPVGTPLSLERAAEAHARVEAGARERVLLALAD